MRDIYSETEVYHTLEEIGKGTFGEVAKCWRGSDGELVAIKTMKIDPERKRVIQNELKLVGVLSRSNVANSNIIQFYETFRDQTHHYLVFELLEKNLYQLQKENGFRPMAVRNIRTVTCQMLKALARLKELGVLHADLKPENVMVVDQARHPFHVKLIDFGSASIFSEVRYVKEPYIQSRFYRSPEILLGLPFSEKVDMWSLGCVVSELLLGWPLYPGESELEQVRFICETQGQPRDGLLNAAAKVHLFFVLHRNNWYLKPSKGRQSAAGVGGRTERRKYIIGSLDQLATLELGSELGVEGSRLEGEEEEEEEEEVRSGDVAAEVLDRRSLVELLKRMLTLDSNPRIQPAVALKHPFVTLAHLGSSPAHARYRAASQLAYERARVTEKVAVDDAVAKATPPPPARAEGHERFLFQRDAKTTRPPPPQGPEGRPRPSAAATAKRSPGEGRHQGDDSGGGYDGGPTPPALSSELLGELSLADDDEVGLEASMAAWAEESGYPFRSSVSSSSSSSSLSAGLSLQAPRLDCPLQNPQNPNPGPANGEEHKSGGVGVGGGGVTNVLNRLCQHLRQPAARTSRSDPTHGLSRTPGGGVQTERAGGGGARGGRPSPSPGDPSPARDPGGGTRDQATQAGQSGGHYGDLEEVRSGQYGGTEGLLCHCGRWSSLPGWTSDPEVALRLTYGSHAPGCCHGNQHPSYLHY